MLLKDAYMSLEPIKFDDGVAYERMMAFWSRLVGPKFLNWLSLHNGRRRIDVGCGNGAITEKIVQRCSPSKVQGIDPSEVQIAFASNREGARKAVFQTGDAMGIPFAKDYFDAATMALVIFLVPDPAQGVVEMKRFVRPEGLVAAYAWDVFGGGMPTAPITAELRASNITYPLPPSVDASRMEVLHSLWADAGLQSVETSVITVERTFANFEEFWSTNALTPSLKPGLAELPEKTIAQLQNAVRERLPVDAQGQITYSSYANAIKGLV